jgi:hypothetical protein
MIKWENYQNSRADLVIWRVCFNKEALCMVNSGGCKKSTKTPLE